MTEIAKPFTLVFCILSLYGVFYTAFLDPTIVLHERIYTSLQLLLLAAGICLVSGLIFREGESGLPTPPLISTLPVQMFCWSSASMLVLFLVSWFLQSHCIFYRDIRFYAGM